MITYSPIFRQETSVEYLDSGSRKHCVNWSCSCDKRSWKSIPCMKMALLLHVEIRECEPTLNPTVVHIFIEVATQDDFFSIGFPDHQLGHELFVEDCSRRSKIARGLEESLMLVTSCEAC